MRQKRRGDAVSIDNLLLDSEQRQAAEASRASYQDRLTAAGYGRITVADAPPFYYAEDYHQRYRTRTKWLLWHRWYVSQHPGGCSVASPRGGHDRDGEPVLIGRGVHDDGDGRMMRVVTSTS
jgi:hypothetical protein